MSQTATRPKRPQGSRPPPSHSASSSSSGSSARLGDSPIPNSQHSINGTQQVQLDVPPASMLDVPNSTSSSQQNQNQTPSRSVTPKPKLLLLKTGGGVAASIGAMDPDAIDPHPPLEHSGLLQLKNVPAPSVSYRPAPPPPVIQSDDICSSLPKASLRPPPIGGGRKRGPLVNVAIPAGSSPIGGIGADEPDAISLLQPSGGSSILASSISSKSSLSVHPQTPLNLGGDDGDVTVRPALPQGHAHAGSMDMIKETLSPPPTSAESNEEDWAEAEEYLEDVKRLGEGAGGEVYMVRDTRTNVRLARKIIQARTTPPKQLVRELRYLKDTGHPNIIKFFGAYISPSSSEVKVIMEFCEGGSLESIGEKIKQGKGRVGEAVAGKIAEGIFNGLAYLHSKKIIHRDIKPSNVLVTRNGVIKLCDFGVSGELVDSVATTWTGTSMYMAPERIQGGQYTIRSDVWSSGLTLLTLAQNRFPYPEDLTGIIELINYITKEDIPQLMDEEPDENGHGEVRWSAEMKAFISVCMTREESARPIPKEMIQHPWLVESSARKVPMVLWIRDVWDWEKKDRGRSAGSRTHSASGSGSVVLSPDDERDGKRRPSAVRLSPRDSSQEDR